MASAKQYAQNLLGNLDLSYLDKEKKVAQDVYNTSKGTLESNYNTLLENINKNKTSSKTDFNRGRATVGESSFMSNRSNLADLASKGRAMGGEQQLGQIGTRMEAGQKYSDLANTYYNTLDTLNASEKEGKQTYSTGLETIMNALNQTNANIDTRGAEARNAYTNTLAQLAEQVQSRWDSEKNARAAIAASNANARNALRQSGNQYVQSILDDNKVLVEPTSYKDYSNKLSIVKGILSYQGLPNTTADAQKYLASYGIKAPTVAATPNSSSNLSKFIPTGNTLANMFKTIR